MLSARRGSAAPCRPLLVRRSSTSMLALTAPCSAVLSRSRKSQRSARSWSRSRRSVRSRDGIVQLLSPSGRTLGVVRPRPRPGTPGLRGAAGDRRARGARPRRPRRPPPVLRRTLVAPEPQLARTARRGSRGSRARAGRLRRRRRTPHLQAPRRRAGARSCARRALGRGTANTRRIVLCGQSETRDHRVLQ